MAKTILVIDDSASLRAVVRMALVKDGHTVIEADNGNTGLLMLGANDVHMVICDLNMPGMNGLEFCAKAKATDKGKYTPILMLTTETSDEKKQQGRAAGAAGWMAKPFSAEQLLKAIQKLAR